VFVLIGLLAMAGLAVVPQTAARGAGSAAAADGPEVFPAYSPARPLRLPPVIDLGRAGQRGVIRTPLAFAEISDGWLPTGRLWAMDNGVAVRVPGLRSGFLQPGGRHVLRLLDDVERYDRRPIQITLADGSSRRLPGPHTYGVPLVSPNGRFIAFGRAVDGGGAMGFVQVLEVATGRPVLTHEFTQATVDWSADGRLLVVGADRITVYDPTVQRVLVSAAPAPDTSVWGGTWSPDGRRVLVGRYPVDGVTTHHEVRDAATLALQHTFRTPVAQPGARWRPLGWVTPGRILWASRLDDTTGSRDTALRWSDTSGRVIGNAIPIRGPVHVWASYAQVR
jgi:hypothetical protein